MSKMKILIPIDESDFSRAIFTTVGQFFSPDDVEITLFEVLDPQSRSLVESEFTSAAEMVATSMIGSIERQRTKQAELSTQQYYQDEARRHQHETALIAGANILISAGFDIKATVEIGDAPEEIVSYARNMGIDMIAMATHGREGLSRLVMGSVAEQVLHKSSVPVLLARPNLNE